MNKNLVSSLYYVDRLYGGPEEGGWFYDAFRYIGPETDKEKFLTEEEIKTLEEDGEIQILGMQLSYIRILGEQYPKKLDGTDNYEPYS